MCGLYGFLHYGDREIKYLSNITNALAEEAAVRGTDATGIAFNENGRLNILKDSKSAYILNFKHSDNIHAVIGHTRHSTQGSEKKNYNNHSFSGRCRNARFALAHNGVLINDKDLRKQYRLPKSKIETDSYIAVQLLEYKKKLNADSIKFMAEAVEGSFSFSILDSNNTIWLVKGDSPLSILHFPDLKLYVYASTEEILWKALIETDLFYELKRRKYEDVKITDGDILNILPDGTLVYDRFNYIDYSGFKSCHWWDYGTGNDYPYMDDLKAVAAYQGYSEEDIDELLSNGFTPEEIEEYIYCCE
ncbi:MAG: class II glutamine amidotransferase [Clostridia bacterium]